MKKIITILSVIFVCSCASVTPGDAAYRGGHYKNAAELYKKGIEQGDSSATIKLALIFNKVKLSPEFKTQLYWFEKACKMGNSVGCHNAGYSYEEGLNNLKTKDLKKAEKFYRIAAEKGYMQSQYNLASMYSNNYIIPKNDIEGYKWFLISLKTAAICSNKKLCQWILSDPPKHGVKLKERMTGEQVSKAQKLAETWAKDNIKS